MRRDRHSRPPEDRDTTRGRGRKRFGPDSGCPCDHDPDEDEAACGAPRPSSSGRSAAVAWSDVSQQRFYVETLGCPEEPGRLGQARRHAAGRWDGPHVRGRRRRSRRRQHVRVHRVGPAGVDRHRPRPRRAAPRGRPPRRHRVHGRALRRRARRGPSRGRPGRRLRRVAAADEAPHADPRQRGPGPRPRPAEPAAAAVVGAVGVRQDRRGLRPLVRVLRHPVVPRPATQPHRGIDPH